MNGLCFDWTIEVLVNQSVGWVGGWVSSELLVHVDESHSNSPMRLQ